MAAKDKKSTAKTSTASTKVTRITASDDAKPKKKAVTSAAPKAEAAPKTKKRSGRNPLKALAAPFVAMGRYFKGSWYELKQVRWPDRRATWGMTGALIGFTAFFVVFILLLDALFKYLFELILR